MGGYGSGISLGTSAKTVVESCQILDINYFSRNGLFRQGYSAGNITWQNYSGKIIRTASWELDSVEDNTDFLIQFSLSVNGETVPLQQSIPTEKTRLVSGGIRWWFICPLFFNGRSCGRRVAKLYRPPYSRYFGCRKCHDLTYKSCQDSHRFDDIFEAVGNSMGIAPEKVKWLLAQRKRQRT